MSLLMKRLMAKQGIHFKDDPNNPGGGGSGAPAGDQGGQGGDTGGQEGGAGDKDTGGKDGDGGAGDKDGDKDGDQGGDKDGDKPDEEKAKLIKDMMKWKTKARETEGKVSEVESQLKQFQEALGDLSVDDIKDMIKAKKDAEIKELEDKKEYQRIVDRMKDEQANELKTLQEQIDALNAQLSERDSKIQDMTIGRGFGESEFIRENSVLPPTIARKEFGAHFDLVDGRVVAYDKPKGAENRTMIVDAQGEPKSFDAAIEELYSKHPDAKSIIRAKAKPGAGSKTQDSPGTKQPTAKPAGRGLSRIAVGLQSKEQ